MDVYLESSVGNQVLRLGNAIGCCLLLEKFIVFYSAHWAPTHHVLPFVKVDVNLFRAQPHLWKLFPYTFG